METTCQTRRSTRQGGADGELGRVAVEDVDVDFDQATGGDLELDAGDAGLKSSAGDGHTGGLEQLRPADLDRRSLKSRGPAPVDGRHPGPHE